VQLPGPDALEDVYPPTLVEGGEHGIHQLVELLAVGPAHPLDPPDALEVAVESE
jgi:hypothetical protein